MRKFKFLLNTLLKIREEKAKKAQTQLQNANLFMQEAASKLDAYKRDLDKVEELLRSKQQSTCRVESLTKLYEYSESIKRKMARQMEITKQAKQHADSRQKEAISALQKLRVMESLKDKKFREWEYEFNRQESKASDDFATISFTHKIKKV